MHMYLSPSHDPGEFLLRPYSVALCQGTETLPKCWGVKSPATFRLRILTLAHTPTLICERALPFCPRKAQKEVFGKPSKFQTTVFVIVRGWDSQVVYWRWTWITRDFPLSSTVSPVADALLCCCWPLKLTPTDSGEMAMHKLTHPSINSLPNLSPLKHYPPVPWNIFSRSLKPI